MNADTRYWALKRTANRPLAAQTGTTEDVAKYSKRTVRVTKEHNDDCKRLLKLMGVPIIEARSLRSLLPQQAWCA